MSKYTIDAKGMDFKELNEIIHQKLPGTEEVIINNACGQRYIGTVSYTHLTLPTKRIV